MKVEYFVDWSGESGAGIRPGYERVYITFEYGHVDKEYFRDILAEYFDGARVTIPGEEKEESF